VYNTLPNQKALTSQVPKIKGEHLLLANNSGKGALPVDLKTTVEKLFRWGNGIFRFWGLESP